MTHHPTQSPQFFLTAPSPCPYVDGQFERKVFTHLVGDKAPEMNDLLTQGGFRRSQNIAYRPACETCRACVSVRILAGEFTVDQEHAPRHPAQFRPDRRHARRRALHRAVFAVPHLSRRPPPQGRHVGHDGARLRHDGRGHACRHQGHRIPPARSRHLHHRQGHRRTDRRGADRQDGRRPVDGLFLFRSGVSRIARSAPS